MYRIELINKRTKEVFNYEYLNDVNNGEKLYFKFEIDTTTLTDGDYHLYLYDGDELIATDTLSINNFNLNGIQCEKGENIYVETIIDAKTQTKQVEIKDVVTTVYPDDGYNVMTQVTVDAQQVYDNGYTQGKKQGKQDGIEEQKSKLSSITIEVNGTYTNEDGYNEVIVNVQPPQQSLPQTEVLLKTITKNGEYNYKPENADYFKEANITVNVLPKLQEKQVTVTETNTIVTPDSNVDGISKVSINALPVYNNAYNVGKSDGIEEQKEKLSSITINGNGKYTNEDGYNEVTVDVKAQGGAFDFNVIGYDDEQTNEANQQINSDIEYSKTVLENWNNGTITKFSNDFQIVYCPQINTSKIISFANFFQNCYSLRKICKISTLSSGYDYSRMFLGCSSLMSICNADIDTSKGTNFESFCESCSNLKEIDIDLSNATNLKQAFTNCKSLQIFNINVSNNTTLDSTFSGCTSLTQINIDTTKTTTLRYFANGCTNLSVVNDLNAPLVTTYEFAFQNCKALITAPKILNCVGTNFKYMFAGCTYLENVEIFDLSNATNVSYMFSSCPKIKTIPNFITSKVSNFGGFLNGATGLESLPLIDMSSATSVTSFFGSSQINNLTEIDGFKNLKINWTSSALDICPNLTRQSLLNVINNLYDFKGTTTTRTLKIGSSNMYRLTDEDKAIATNKGWTLTN